MIVHVLIATAVYDHGVVGVYATREDAVRAAEAIWPTTDGHHAFRVDEYEVGRSHPDVFTRTFWSEDVRGLTQEPLRISFESPTPATPF